VFHQTCAVVPTKYAPDRVILALLGTSTVVHTTTHWTCEPGSSSLRPVYTTPHIRSSQTVDSKVNDRSTDLCGCEMRLADMFEYSHLSSELQLHMQLVRYHQRRCRGRWNRSNRTCRLTTTSMDRAGICFHCTGMNCARLH
jgi:hypothetical protein